MHIKTFYCNIKNDKADIITGQLFVNYVKIFSLFLQLVHLMFFWVGGFYVAPCRTKCYMAASQLYWWRKSSGAHRALFQARVET